VDDRPRRQHRDDHQDDRTDPLGPERPAEKEPPHEDRRCADDASEHSEIADVGRDDRADDHDEQLGDGDDDSGPQPQRLSSSHVVALCNGHWETGASLAT
jgi:hypothetical protein